MVFIKSLVKNLITFSAKASVVFILVIVVILLGIGQFFAKTSDLTQPQTFRVEGTAKRKVIPDIARITIGELVQGQDVVKIQNEANSKVNNAVKAMKNLGIPEEKIQTSTYNLTPEYDWETGKIKSYSINVEVRVEVNNVNLDENQAGDVIEAAAKAGLNEVRSLSFDVEKRDEITEELKLEAIDDAKNKKDSIAKASGLRLGELKNVNFGFTPYYDTFERGIADAPAEPGFAEDQSVTNVNIEPGETELRASVTLIYEIL